MNTINLLAGPVVGALIGYATNFLAVKMLFRPLNPIRIGNFILPFTPGIIPKRKEELAKALGKTVGHNLLTSEDIGNMFLTEEIRTKIVTETIDFLFGVEKHTLKTMLTDYCTEEEYLCSKAYLEKMLCEKIASGISELDLGEIIVNESRRVIKEKTEGTMLALMANDKLIGSVTAPLGAKVEAYIKENGITIIRPIVNKEIENLENQPIAELVLELGLEKEQLSGLVDRIYSEFIRRKVAGFVSQFDIPGIVEQKVNTMDALEIEKLVLSVMKKELRAIVNLGALIGCVIGTVIIFV